MLWCTAQSQLVQDFMQGLPLLSLSCAVGEFAAQMARVFGWGKGAGVKGEGTCLVLVMSFSLHTMQCRTAWICWEHACFLLISTVLATPAGLHPAASTQWSTPAIAKNIQ